MSSALISRESDSVMRIGPKSEDDRPAATVPISVFGLGYVGAVTAACLAHQGHRVMAVDINPAKVEAIESSRSPILEPQMEQLVADGHKACHLHATLDAVAAVCGSHVSFVCVGTPGSRNGKLDLTHIDRVCRDLGSALKRKRSYHLVVIRSTLLPGTTRSFIIPALESSSGMQAGRDFGVCYSPEFLREGTAVADFFQPPFVVLGAGEGTRLDVLRSVYSGATAPLYETSLEAAEMVKYTCNAFHALKVSFANEIGTLCKQLGVDTEAVSELFMSDTRLNISSKYLQPGFAFGGSCLPKDLRALAYRAKELDLHLPLLEAILPSNTAHLDRAVELILQTKKSNVSVLGLSFKTGTDDLRESPQVQLIKRLLSEGCRIRIWDDKVMMGRLVGSNRQFIEDVIPHIGALLSPNLEEVVTSAEVVVLGTRCVDKQALAAYLHADQVIIDLVNCNRSHRPKAVAGYDGICW